MPAGQGMTLDAFEEIVELPTWSRIEQLFNDQ
jgi:hypothetical protein